MISILHRNDEEDLRETESRAAKFGSNQNSCFPKNKNFFATLFVSASLENAYVLKESG